jgi:hypothetical protein
LYWHSRAIVSGDFSGRNLKIAQSVRVMDDDHYIVERRITERVQNYWQSLCHSRIMPEEVDIDTHLLGDDWAHCFLLQTRDIDHIAQFNFTYLGDAIVQHYLDSNLDHDNVRLIGPNAFYLAPMFKKVVETRKPWVDQSHFFTNDGREVRYRQCLLPLGTPKHVEAIFGAVFFKVVI